MLKKIWNDPVGSKLIAKALWLIGPLFLIAAIYFYSWILSLLKSLWTFATSDTLTPNWMLGLLGAFSLMFLSLLGFFIWQWAVEEFSKPSYRDYREDIFFGMKWRWKYSTTEKSITIPRPSCPTCSYDIIPTRTSISSIVDIEYTYHCDNCEKDITKLKEQPEVTISKVERQAIRKINTGEWEK